MEVFYGANKSSPADFQEHRSRQTARQSSGHEEHPGKYPGFGSGFLRDELQKGVGRPLPDAFSGSFCNQMQQLRFCVSV